MGEVFHNLKIEGGTIVIKKFPSLKQVEVFDEDEQ